jgi:hypothetical protein
VAIQADTPTRDAAGAEVHGWNTVTGLESIPATIMPVVDEERQERDTPELEKWSIILGGHLPQIDTAMAILHGDRRFEINRVSTTYGRRMTTVLARRVTVNT